MAEDGLYWLIGVNVATLVVDLIVPKIDFLWRFKKQIYFVNIFLITFSSSAILSVKLNTITALLVFFCIYRAINGIRIVSNRSNDEYLKKSSFNVSASYGVISLGLLVIWLIISAGELNVRAINVVNIILAIQITFLLAISLFVIINLHKTKSKSVKNIPDANLPTLSVAIPARNETKQLAITIDSILRSNYPKLEVLVLDDCSQDNTQDIIKSFAHEGVVFVRGKNPKKGWLSKNQAYDELAKRANGEYIFFCGVDLNIGVNGFKKIILQAVSTNKDMVCVFPTFIRKDSSIIFVQQLRYLWELTFPRFAMKQPPALSTGWLIKTTSLKKCGGFTAITNNIRPEKYFAKKLSSNYLFANFNNFELFSTSKEHKEQLTTALRNGYLELHKRIDTLSILTLLSLAMFITPIYALFSRQSYSILLAIFTYIALCLPYLFIIKSACRKIQLIDVLSAIINPLLFIIIINESMRRYEFDEISWKDRNVCEVVMQRTNLMNTK